MPLVDWERRADAHAVALRAVDCTVELAVADRYLKDSTLDNQVYGLFAHVDG